MRRRDFLRIAATTAVLGTVTPVAAAFAQDEYETSKLFREFRWDIPPVIRDGKFVVPDSILAEDRANFKRIVGDGLTRPDAFLLAVGEICCNEHWVGYKEVTVEVPKAVIDPMTVQYPAARADDGCFLWRETISQALRCPGTHVLRTSIKTAFDSDWAVVTFTFITPRACVPRTFLPSVLTSDPNNV